MGPYQYYAIHNRAVNSSVIKHQQESIMSQITSKQFTKDSIILEKTLNDFFYNKTGDNYEKYYEEAMKLASEEFNKRYANYPFSLNTDKMTAKFSNSNIYFVDKTADLQKIQAMADHILALMNSTGQKKETWLSILTEIKRAQSLPADGHFSKSINGIIASILFGNKTVYGDAFEYPLAAFASLLDNGANAESEKLLESFQKNLQGGQRSKTQLNISYLNPEERKYLQINNSVQINEGTTIEYNNPTQDKVDVKLILNQTPYNISAKSYSSIYRDIHILGGASLSSPLLNMNSVDFVSGYLSSLFYGSPSKNPLQDYHNILKLEILFMSLSGKGTSALEGEADVFVINDKQNKRIIVRNISEIISSIIKTGNWKYININGNGPEIPDTSLRNYKEQKIKNVPLVPQMLNKIHDIKLSVSIRGTAVAQSR